jgi:hypothetical protein
MPAMRARCPLWVKLRRTQPEQLFSDLPPKADLTADIVDVSQVPLADISAASLDHLVGGYEQAGWHCEAKRLGGLEIDHEFKLGGLLDR